MSNLLLAKRYQLSNIRAVCTTTQRNLHSAAPVSGLLIHSLPFFLLADLNIEVVGNCMVRIKGVASQRYLVMEENGTLSSKVCTSCN